MHRAKGLGAVKQLTKGDQQREQLVQSSYLKVYPGNSGLAQTPPRIGKKQGSKRRDSTGFRATVLKAWKSVRLLAFIV